MNCQTITAALTSYPARAAYFGLSCIVGVGAVAGNAAIPFIQRQRALKFGDFVLQELAKNSTELVQNISRAYNSLESDLKTQALWCIFLAGLVPVCVWYATRLYPTVRNQSAYETLGNGSQA